MRKPSLSVDWRECHSQTTALQSLAASLTPLGPHHQKLVAEIAMVRLFLMVDNLAASIGAKLLCGAAYLDGSSPKNLVAAHSMSGAYQLMRTHGRAKPTNALKWSQAKFIRENLEKTLDPTDQFFAALTRHGHIINQMRRVRNHIAHHNEGTAREFRQEVVARYGGPKKGMTPGLFLLSPGANGTRKLDEYIVSCRVIFKELVRA